ncbi:translation initiation factor 1 (eIF-1/SUI1) [Aeromonas sp. RU39B]|jgi:translation initiation factor 1|uniref:translation initiation factor n=1 Tax=Aeromonas sp. RU39B TaxID=1907416 RepID=UPI000953BA95|nr:translation initiation factor [Aeromonas sp. RU39B]SIR34549.1 translation initiation factor 1 (eIF-1/SUI1) [Aeromonas sp. RU39B]
MSQDSNSRLVYSTDGGHVAQDAAPTNASPFPDDGIVRLRRETKGRKGAGVITVFGVPPSQQKAIATLLKKKCGTGGSLKEGVIEIQGDKRDLIKAELEKAGFSVKLVGG